MAEQKPFLTVGRKFVLTVALAIFFMAAPKLGLDVEAKYVDALVALAITFLAAEGGKDVVNAVGNVICKVKGMKK